MERSSQVATTEWKPKNLIIMDYLLFSYVLIIWLLWLNGGWFREIFSLYQWWKDFFFCLQKLWFYKILEFNLT